MDWIVSKLDELWCRCMHNKDNYVARSSHDLAVLMQCVQCGRIWIEGKGSKKY